MSKGVVEVNHYVPFGTQRPLVAKTTFGQVFEYKNPQKSQNGKNQTSIVYQPKATIAVRRIGRLDYLH
jgi:hypothetical protein